MRLRRITLSGFKTFAARSEVIFDPGITAIVGPNGSGKSNLVDAVRWALGETNARELRGQRMDEVIYSGGGGRQRMGLAQVELVMDNEDGSLPSEDPEVSVSRRVARGDRDTEFRINGDHARLRDLERLLGGTGLTQNGYAVVVQNDIDGIIEATPAQRRTLVEQAAGRARITRRMRGGVAPPRRRRCDRPASHRSARGRDTRDLRSCSEQSVAAIELRTMSAAPHRAARQPGPRGVARRASEPQAGPPPPRAGARTLRGRRRGGRSLREPGRRGAPAPRRSPRRARRRCAPPRGGANPGRARGGAAAALRRPAALGGRAARRCGRRSRRDRAGGRRPRPPPLRRSRQATSSTAGRCSNARRSVCALIATEAAAEASIADERYAAATAAIADAERDRAAAALTSGPPPRGPNWPRPQSNALVAELRDRRGPASPNSSTALDAQVAAAAGAAAGAAHRSSRKGGAKRAPQSMPPGRRSMRPIAPWPKRPGTPASRWRHLPPLAAGCGAAPPTVGSLTAVDAGSLQARRLVDCLTGDGRRARRCSGGGARGAPRRLGRRRHRVSRSHSSIAKDRASA